MHKRAKHIVETLKNHGYIAYYAGGWVRDFLLNIESDDIDIATNASPKIIQSIFSHTVPIGEAFGIILVIIDSHQYEVASFRKDLEYKDGRRPSKIEFTTPLEDAKRRDFTINGMFFDPITNEIIDFVEGKKDLKRKIIKAIGDPNKRLKEDRLRMLRAIRLSCRFGFEIEENTKKAIFLHSNELLKCVAIERIYSELKKMAKYKNFKTSILELFNFKILQNIFPSIKNIDYTTLEDRIKYIDFFPEKTPTIIKILEIFGEKPSLEEKIAISQKLKLSNKEISFVELFSKIKKTVEDEESYKKTNSAYANSDYANSDYANSDYDWAKIYSKKDSSLILKILSSKKNLKEQKEFLENHKQKKEALSSFVLRIQKKDPVVKSFHLQEQGIKPSLKMGLLLKEAEKISINEKIEDPSKIIEILKKTSLWKKNI